MSSFITNLPDNSEGLSHISDQINNMRLTIDDYFKNLNRKIYTSPKEIENCRNKLQDYLYTLADYTMPIFDLSDKMELHYYTVYKDKNLASIMWLEHYRSLHKPYDVQKNFCYFLIGKLDKYLEEYNRRKKNGEIKLLKEILC